MGSEAERIQSDSVAVDAIARGRAERARTAAALNAERARGPKKITPKRHRRAILASFGCGLILGAAPSVIILMTTLLQRVTN